MSVDINWNLATQQPNMLQLAQQGFETGRAQKMQRVQDEALAKIGANPNDTQALNALLPVNPTLYGQLATAQQARLKLQREDQTRQAFQGAYNPQTGQIDPTKVRQAYAQTGDIEGAMKFDGDQATMEKTRLETGIKKLEVMSQLLGASKDPASYAANRARAAQMGLDVSTVPEQYDPAFVQSTLQAALSAKEQAEQQWKALNYKLDVAKFGNQVTQQGIDNQYQAANLNVAEANLGLRAAEVQNSAAGGLSPKEARRATVELRKQFDGLPEVKAFKELAPVLVSARRAPDTPAGDIQLAYTVGKVLDPNSVVREGELAMVAAAGSPVERILGTTRFVADGKARLTPTQRQQLLGMLNERALANRQAYDAAYTNYAQYATDSGVSPRAVVGTHAANAFRQPQARAAAPQEKRVAGGTLTAPVNGVREWRP